MNHMQYQPKVSREFSGIEIFVKYRPITHFCALGVLA
jgi:hypothetical protein